MSWWKIITLSISFVTSAAALIGTVVFLTNGINSRINSADEIAAQDRRFFLQQAADDRLAFNISMDEFRKEMQRLAERQSRIDGIVDAILVENFNQ